MSGSASFNPAAFVKLRELGGDEFARRMVELFFQYVPEKLAEAKSAGQRGDLDAVHKASHPIKSSARQVGASAVAELAARIEKLASENNGEAITLLGELESAYEQVSAQLRQQVQG